MASSRPPSIIIPSAVPPPALFQRLRHDKSILSIAISSSQIFAGTQGGEILVYSLSVFERLAVIDGHNGSVLGLCLSREEDLLLSSAADRIVNVWNTRTHSLVYSIYSTYDIGDVFCVAYSSRLQTVYLGAQNTSIQWYDLKDCERRPRPKPDAHPSFRTDKFFDSYGPGGFRTPRNTSVEPPRHVSGGKSLEIQPHDICRFAHYGYVYCMALVRGIVAGGSDKEVLISGGGDGVIKLWNLDPKSSGAISELDTLDDGRDEGRSILSIALDGTFLYSGRNDGEIDVWDLETRQLLRRLKTTSGDVMTISVGGGFLFSAGVTGVVEKFNRHYERVARFRAHEGLVLASASTMHGDRYVLATGGNDGSIAVWDLQDSIFSPAEAEKTSDERLVESLKKFVSYRTVSSDPRYKGDCRRGASFLRSMFRNFGASTEMLNAEDPCNPLILAKFSANATAPVVRNKILFYGHYDVIAAENEHGKWLADPFTLEGIDGYLYGRGASDNKGPIIAAIYAVAELIADKALASDVVFLIEGEEECGSRGFAKAVKTHKSLIGDIDWILLANSYWLDDHMPCLTYGLRGVIRATVQVESKHPDLHSGVDGSALLDESLKDLVMLLSNLTGKQGKIEISGFYDPIPPLAPEEENLYYEITEALIARNPDLGDRKNLANSLMRRWREASLTIHRFHTSGPENSTIIPRLARASLSLRLVPNQSSSEVSKALVAFLEEKFRLLESSNVLTVTIDHQAEPWLGDYNNELFKTLETAIMEVWGSQLKRRTLSMSTPKAKNTHNQNGVHVKRIPATSKTLASASASDSVHDEEVTASNTGEADGAPTRAPRRPLYIREGGSIPAIRFLETEFDAPAAHLPCGQASDNAHLDNERLRLVNLYQSKEIFKRVFRYLPAE